MKLKPISQAGLGLFTIGITAFIFLLSMSNYKLTGESLGKAITNPVHQQQLLPVLSGMMDNEYTSKFEFIGDFKSAFASLNDQLKANQQWDQVIWTDYTFSIVKESSSGFLFGNLWIWYLVTFGFGIAGALLYIFPHYSEGPAGIKNNHIFLSAISSRGWLGVLAGSGLILFYIVLYWYPEYITNWVILMDPVALFLSGSPASQWFLYGFLYTVAVLVMGIRMFLKYRGNQYQLVRTASVMFFQTAVAFLIPQILTQLQLPANDLKNIWPLDYSFFFDYRIDQHIQAGTLGIVMLVWGIGLFAVGVPVFTYYFGKRWYCSWVCGCGGLAETLGDPFRQLSDKSLKAWQIERWLIHSVLVFAGLMTVLVLYTYFTKESTILGLNSYDVRQVYGFLIGAAFAGVVGTGFYPLMGNRVWCRFGCPLAAYIGFFQKVKSRFRITTNGGQCISCGNCSTYCEMGIDVRSYAQKGQNIVRSSCVGCGVCSAVCPRGVLKLENGPEDGRVQENPILIGNDSFKVKGLH